MNKPEQAYRLAMAAWSRLQRKIMRAGAAFLSQNQESEVITRSVLKNALDAVVAMDHRGLIIQWNPQAEKIFGYTRSEAIGRRMSETIIPQHYRDAHETGMRRYLKTGEGPILNKRIEIAAVDRSGREFPVELTITPIFTRRPVCFYAFLRDISERKSAEAERSRLLRELEQAVRRRDEFISMASHELKTPLTSLRLQFQIAARQIAKGDSRVYSEESLNRRIDITNRQLDRMTKLIEDMLDVSRVTAGRLEMRLERDDLSQVVREAADDFRDSLLLGGHTIVAELEPGLFADFDRYRMEQVLLNLLTNAFKYGAGSPVKLTLKKVGGRARLTVEDQGPGIPESEFGRIFQRFERAASQNEVTGLGLGLFISRYIVEGHRGKIWVESEIGRGSRFIVELPLAQ